LSTSNKKDNKYQIAVIPGDGIGSEVMEATISVLDELNLDFDYKYGLAGDECNEKHGTPLPQETLDLVRNSDACLFGAAGETAADVIVKIRQEMKMFANLRPVKSYPNTNALFENIDFMIVRENTEGLYIADQEEETEEGAIAKRIITR
jgi:3-isopropylmalate dehydrogenase